MLCVDTLDQKLKMITMKTRSYEELRRIDTFEERFEYLKLGGSVGEATFGNERWLNQRFYTSREWKQIRQHVIARDEGCDLGVEGFEIYDKIIIHHMNPMTPKDIVDFDEAILNPDFLISVTLKTHNAIHYGNSDLLPKPIVERRRGDHILW